MTPPETLMYWIRERYDILLKKKTGAKKPWSEDPIFHNTYFCNVRREDDKVTKWIRNYYSPHVSHPLFEYNICLARFLNWPDTLGRIGYQEEHNPTALNEALRAIALEGRKVWGGAYLITTCGVKQDKVDYLTHDVLEAVFERSRAVKNACQYQRGGGVLAVLEGVRGIGSFLAGQIIADLKNTPKHLLANMEDWWSFVVPGPGSTRGCSWFWYGDPHHMANREFEFVFGQVREYADKHWPSTVPMICNQDLQNCLCEYDKYMRVKNGTGRSKRRYEGV